MYQQNPFSEYKIYKTNTLNDKNCFNINENVKILTIVPETNPEELNFVNKVMKTLNLDSSNIQIVSINESDTFSLIEKISSNSKMFVLLMGIKPRQLGLNLDSENYTISNLFNLTIAKASSPSMIMKSKDEKAQLWNLLKTTILNEG